MKTTDFNFFIQDDWRVTPRLTLNLGLRYEYQQNPDAVAPNPALPQTANKVDDKNNFGPRIGFAFDMTGDGKTSLRGGWGLYYGRVINSTVYSALTNTGLGPSVSQQQLTIATIICHRPRPHVAVTQSRPKTACRFIRTCWCRLARPRRTSLCARRSSSSMTTSSCRKSTRAISSSNVRLVATRLCRLRICSASEIRCRPLSTRICRRRRGL